MISFKIVKHHQTRLDMVEVFKDDKLLACIYADAGLPALKLVSKHLDVPNCVVDPNTPPAVLLPFIIQTKRIPTSFPEIKYEE